MALATCEDYQSISGGSLYISATLPATYNEAGYEALTWTEVGGVTSLPSVGGTFSEVSIPLVKTGTCKKKGTKDFGTGSIEFAAALTDSGQIAMIAAYNSYDSVAFKILYADGSADYVTGNVLGVPKTNGAGGNAAMITAPVSWTTERVEVAS